MNRRIAVTLVALVVSGGNLWAQEVVAPMVRIGIHAGYVSGGDVEEASSSGGGQVEISLNDVFGLEASVSGFVEDADESDLMGGTDASLALATGGLSAVLKLNRGPVTLYGLGGVNFNAGRLDIETSSWLGGAELDIDVDGTGYHVGGGMRFAFGPRMELFAEYRHTFLELEGDGEVEVIDPFGVTVIADAEVDFDYDFGMAKAGLNFLF